MSINFEPKRILITGGAGFIGANLARKLTNEMQAHVLVYDALTYAGTRTSLAACEASPRFQFVQGDIRDAGKVRETMTAFEPDAIMNLAAESHVDRSIDSPSAFIETNIVGTFVLLQAALEYFQRLGSAKAAGFRFHHISTDEVFGSLGPSGAFTENTPYDPRSPYSASKAGSDHLVRAWRHTYGLPTLLTNCSNNYGPYQFPEKLIPVTILNALEGRPLPVYGNGANVREWLYVEDHADALCMVLQAAAPGSEYVVGSGEEKSNLDVVRAICAVLDETQPKQSGGRYGDQIAFVRDRPGHDARYAIDTTRLRRELGWRPQHTFASGLADTVAWYIDNEAWWSPLRHHASQRLGLGAPALS